VVLLISSTYVAGITGMNLSTQLQSCLNAIIFYTLITVIKDYHHRKFVVLGSHDPMHG
jgi:hypothetical protein